ncbi:unnamed protein product [Citrullus colocynthis]|uniref:Cystatin domain-containing protein n=1 Tax=Citrullus colocynthis TaxID=252529 RepID=A0ABP0YKS6_9ROSI
MEGPCDLLINIYSCGSTLLQHIKKIGYYNMSNVETNWGPLEVIEDINVYEVQEVGCNAVNLHNEKQTDNLIFLHVVNGLKQISDNGYARRYIVVVKVKNADGIVWTYVVNIQVIPNFRPWPLYTLISFEDPLKFYN